MLIRFTGHFDSQPTKQRYARCLLVSCVISVVSIVSEAVDWQVAQHRSHLILVANSWFADMSERATEVFGRCICHQGTCSRSMELALIHLFPVTLEEVWVPFR
jgi:hypothetical protein